MTRFLDYISNIGHYTGAGMVMLLIGIALIIISVIRLSRYREADRKITVAEFNQQFLNETGNRISDVEAGSVRKETAERLGIGTVNR
jgi:hypothetical protein